MESIKQATIVKEMTEHYRKRMYNNIGKNSQIEEYYLKMLAAGIVKKRMPPDEICTIRKRMIRLQGCNRFWSVETYEASHVKVLMRTFLCKDKFCSNCNQMKKLILQKRFLPHMEQYKDSLYHIVLTVPDCRGENLRRTIQQMTTCFKTLVTYLNGNKKVKGIDLIQYEFQGCLRSLEITYKEDVYHPHFHIAAVLGNGGCLENKHISNKFSNHGKRLFSDFEAIVQRIWWLLINQKRLTSDNILKDTPNSGRYSCIADKFQPEDYKKLFGYMTKMYSEDNSPMTYENFRTLYHSLSRVRQIQGYGIFYNTKEPNTEMYTEQDYKILESYLLCKEQPKISYEPLSHFMGENEYTVLKPHPKNKIKFKPDVLF